MDAVEHPVSPEWARQAHIDNERYLEMYARSIRDPDGFWAEQAEQIDWFRTPTVIRNVDFGHPDVSIKWYEDGVLNIAHNCLDRHLATRGDRTAIIWEGDDPAEDRRITYRELHPRCLPLRQCPEGAGRPQGRPGHPLPADDPGGGGRHAGLRPHRRHPFHRLRRLLAGGAGRPDRRLRFRICRHRRRGAARRPHGAAQGQYRCRHRHRRQDPQDRGGEADRGGHSLGRRPGLLVSRADGGGFGRVPGRADECRGPAVHPLHIGLDRQAEGRAAHHRRLCGLYRHDPPADLRLPRWATSTGAPPMSAG